MLLELRNKCRNGVRLTKRCQVPAVLQHHIFVQCFLRRVQQCPLFLGKLYGHILEGHHVLKSSKTLWLSQGPLTLYRKRAKMARVGTGNSKQKVYFVYQSSGLYSNLLLDSALTLQRLNTGLRHCRNQKYLVNV